MRLFRPIVTASIILTGLSLGTASASPPHDRSGLSTTAGRLGQSIQSLQSTPAGVVPAHHRQDIVALSEDLQVSLLLVEERLHQQGLRLTAANPVIRQRHRDQLERFAAQAKRLRTLLPKLLVNESVSLGTGNELLSILEQFSVGPRTLLHGVLPYRKPTLDTGLPQNFPPLTPAYQGSHQNPLPADLQPSALAPRSPAIVALLQEIAASAGRRNWDPVDIYQWVNNNIRTEWYCGIMKGAEETLLQRAGNDADQAALLVALLRAAGYPARYLVGTVQLLPNLLSIQRLTGIDDAERLGTFLTAAGIPNLAIRNGSTIDNYWVEHVWVEAYVPYDNYRGRMGDQQGRRWIALDTSWNYNGFDEQGVRDLFDEPDQPLAGLRDAYLSAGQTGMPLDMLHTTVDAYLAERFPTLSYPELLHRRTQHPESLEILPALPMFYEGAIVWESADLPEVLLHQVRLQADDGAGGEPLFDLTLPLYQLSSRQVQISYLPETVADQETVNLWGGLDNTPAYLVRLRPVLLVDDQQLAVGTRGVAPGEVFSLQVSSLSYSGTTVFENQLIAGYPTLLAVVAQEVVFPDAADRSDDAIDLLHHAALDYIDRWNRDERELADLLKLQLTRPLPTIVSIGGQLAVEELLGAPQSVTWTGLYLDADQRQVAAVPRGASWINVAGREQTFMQLSALQGSALEHRVLEDAFAVESLSTAKLFGLAQTAGVPLLTIDAQNSAELLATVTAEPAVLDDINAAVAAGLTVHLPQQPLTLHAWSGTGWLKEDLVTGEAGYMLSGKIAGGSTVMGREFWPAMPLDRLLRPFTAAPNPDPQAAHRLVSITPWEIRWATAGEELDGSLMVGVQDEAGVPVSGAPVVFSVSRGGGALLDDSIVPASPVQQLTALSGSDGIARARFVPGENVYLNPVAVARPGQQQANITGENLIEVQLASGSQASLETPVAILGFAGLPDPQQSQLQGDGLAAQVQSFAGTAGVILRDRFGNPVANYPVTLTSLPASFQLPAVCDPASQPSAMRLAELIAPTDACLKQLPVRGECSSARSSLSITSRSDGSALAGIVLGGLAGASYPLNLTYVAAGKVTHNAALTLRSAGGACRTDGAPQATLVLNYPQLQDSAGRNVDARPIGSRGQLVVKSYLLHEESELLSRGETLNCSPDPARTCDRMLATGNFALKAPDQVTGNGEVLPRVARMTGSQAAPFLYGLDLTVNQGLNQIPLTATASHTVTSLVNSCDGCGSPSTASRSVGPVSKVAEVWGVAIDLPATLAVPVDSKGRLTRDFNIPFSIRPAEYVAGFAQVLIFADGSLWETLLAPTSGSGTVTLPQGYYFDPTKNYQVQVLLGQVGEVNAILSSKTPIIPMLSSIDLQIDALPDLLESQIGAFVLLNNDFDEQEADPTVTEPDATTPGMLASDDELKRAWVQIDDPDMLGGTWQVRASEPSRLRLFAAQNGTFTELKADDPPQLIDSAPLSVALYLEGLGESPGLHSDSLTLTYVSAQGMVLNEVVPVTVVHLDMAVDGNRDRVINFLRGYDERALFWVNNDRDVTSYDFGDGLETEDDEETGNDSFDGRISCKRDLEDLARLQIKFGNALHPDLLEFSLAMIAEDGSTQPMLNLFAANDESSDYLGITADASPTAPDEQVAKPMLAAVGSHPAKLPVGTISRSAISPFVYEGRAAGDGRLVLSALYKGLPVLQRQIQLGLKDIRYFYDHFIVEESGDPAVPVRRAVNPEGVGDQASRRGLYEPATDEYVLFVHGWNMQPWLKKRWTETVFKRLWWQGYQGKVGVFDWPNKTYVLLPGPQNFDHSEFVAWNSASALSRVLGGLRSDSRKISLLAHSQGNVVAVEALRQVDDGTVEHYTASQAAITASVVQADRYAIFPRHPDDATFDNPDVYGTYPTAQVKQPFADRLSGKVAKLQNYSNFRDSALSIWQLNNRLKPDLGYGYVGDKDTYPEFPSLDHGFYTGSLFSERVPLALPGDTYRIFTYAAEAHSLALGAVQSTGNASWVVHDLTGDGFGYNDNSYSHSRQFRSNVVAEQGYWSLLTRDNAFTLSYRE